MTAERWSGRTVHESGESARARAAEERHAAGERAQAVRTVAGRAIDAEDCSLLLSILGLDVIQDTPNWEPSGIVAPLPQHSAWTP